jgi:cardiolipin synthase C
VADRRRAFVGSYNLDPRSRSINTEMGIVFESDSLANELAALIGEEMSDGFRLSLRKDQVVWTGALEISRTSEPGASLSRKFFAWVAGFLPIESQL